MDALKTILESQKALESSFTERFMQLDAALKSASPHSHPTITSLAKEISCFKEQASAMLQLLREQILNISNTVDNIEMRHRRKFLQIDGMPEVAGENITESVASACGNTLKLPQITCSSITTCHRLGARTDNRPRSVLVRFSDLQVRNSVWQKKTALKGTAIVISEFLTRQRRATFIAARKHFGMRNVWTLDGNICIKMPCGKKERLTTAEQLQVLTSRYAPIPASKPVPIPGPAAPAVPGSNGPPAPVHATVSAPKLTPSQPSSADGSSKKTEERRGQRRV